LIKSDKEISLIDVLIFLIKAWKTILLFGVLGVIGSIAYLLVAPNRYEAIAQIQMARIAVEKNPLGANVEEPAALINRLRLPSGLNDVVNSACGLQDSRNPASDLGKIIKLTIPRGAVSMVELKVVRPTPELAKACAVSVVDWIVQSQAQMIDLIVDVTKVRYKERLAKTDERLAQDKALLPKVDQSKGVISPAYFALLSEIRSLEDERERLIELMDGYLMPGATFQSSIFVDDQPIFPIKAISLLVGLLGGIFLGVMIELGKKIFITLKYQILEAL